MFNKWELSGIVLVVAVYTVISTLGGCKNSESGWNEMFKKNSLEDWTIKGGNMQFSFEEKELIGVAVPGEPNGFLCSKKSYRDFILEYEFLPNPKLNSGVQIRGQSNPDYLNGRVHGLQVEIDPSDRAWTAGIYDEARRGWLYPLNDNQQARLAYKPLDWNHIRVEAIGDTIKTWLNNIPASWLVDNTDSAGFIGFQVHTVRNIPENKGLSIRFRNVRIITRNPKNYIKKTVMNLEQINVIPNSLTRLEILNGWQLLFDGRTSAGWTTDCSENSIEKGWLIEDGNLTTRPISDSTKGSLDLRFEKKFTNYDLRFEFRITQNSSSGVLYMANYDSVKNNCKYSGLEYQIIDDKIAGLQSTRQMACLYDILESKNKFPSTIGQWNSGRIVKKGSLVEYWLNNLKVLDFDMDGNKFIDALDAGKKTENFKSFIDGANTTGFIILQHENSLVSFRNLKIRQL